VNTIDRGEINGLVTILFKIISNRTLETFEMCCANVLKWPINTQNHITTHKVKNI